MRKIFLLVLVFTSSALAFDEDKCKAEYDKGNLVGGVYGEMLGVIEGTIYGFAIHNSDGSFCLSGAPKEKVKMIAQTLQIASDRGDKLEFEDVPSKESSLLFLRTYFPCPKVNP